MKRRALRSWGTIPWLLLVVSALAADVGRACDVEPPILPDPPDPAAPALSHAHCQDGLAAGFACSNVDLRAFLPIWSLGGGFGNDIWGWTDPLDGREIAIAGYFVATAFVDVSDPDAPVHLGNLPTHTVADFWNDIRVYANHAYIVSEAADHGMQIFDLTGLRDISAPPAALTETAHYAGFGRAHNIAVNEETGFAYVVGSDTCSGGLHMLDLSDPLNPLFVGCHVAEGYVHDAQCVIYRGPDAAHQGREICFNSNSTWNVLAIVDVTDKAATQTLSVRNSPGTFAHQGWLTEDHRYFLLGDEADEWDLGHNSRTYIWDVTDLDAPVLVGNYTSASTAADHNLYVRGDHVFEANYTSGLRVLRMGNLANTEVVEVGFFDTYGTDDSLAFVGAWGSYPFFESGIVVVGDTLGLFVLEPHASAVPECADGIDNDGDGLSDSPGDPGCAFGASPVEDPGCNDGIDNDGDGFVDFPADPQCAAASSLFEGPITLGCGLGAELALILAALLGWHRRSRPAPNQLLR